MRARLFIQLAHIPHLAPQRAERAQAGARQGWGLGAGGRFVYLFTCLPVSTLVVPEITFRKVLWALFKGYPVPGFSTIMR